MISRDPKTLARQILWKASARLYDRLVKPTGQIYSIGIYIGDALPMLCAGSARNPVLTRDDVTDVPAAFLADPFMIRRDDCWHMFFEVMNSSTRLGQIGWATSSDGLQWEYRQVVLSEGFHLAYPYVFEWQGGVYMVPDSPGHGIRLYRADEFPGSWKFVAPLRDEGLFSDSTPFEFDGHWWMLSGWVANKRDPMSLRLFCADSPLGPWSEHPASPVVARNDHLARPGGRVVMVDGIPHRFAQDCTTSYGRSLTMLRIETLTPTRYQECVVGARSVLGPGNEHWNSEGMHHMDAHRYNGGRWIACVDGWHMAEAHG